MLKFSRNIKRCLLSLFVASSVAANIAVPINAYSPNASGSLNSMSATDRAIFNQLVGGNTSNIVRASAGSISTSIEGRSSVNGYQWTAWYNENNKNFAIDKTQTNGTYNVGVPTKTGNNQVSANMTKAGYYKYLSDPIYSEIRLKASQTFNWVTANTSKVNTYAEDYYSPSYPKRLKRSDAIKHTATTFSIVNIAKDLYKIINKYEKKELIDGLNAHTSANCGGGLGTSGSHNGGSTFNKTYSNGKQSIIGATNAINNKLNSWINGSVSNISTANYSTVSVIEDSGNRKVIETKIYSGTVSAYNQECKSNYAALKLDVDVYHTVIENHSQTIEVANTVVAQNVSATELSKYATFTLKSKNGGTGVVNTQVVKSNGGWWGSNHPAYHQGNNTTTDANGTYYYWSNSGSGSNGVNLRNIIPIKEKLYTFAGVPTNLGKDNKYTLTINPNGGEYNGNPGITSIKQLIGTSYTVNTPSRDGYILSGWDFSGSGTWNPNNQKYTFGTGDGSLTAKWIAKTPETDPNNPDNTNKKYTLTIDPNGGKYNNKTTPTTITKKIGDSESIKNPKRTDYIFLGWKVVSGDSNCFSQGTSSSMYKFYSDATLQAQWIKKGQSNSGTVIIDPNGGNYDGSTNKVTISGNAGSTTTIKTPVKDGYIFKGWEVINIEKNKFNGNTFTFIQGTTTLKAKWEVIKIDPCIVNGTGVDACGTNQDSMPGTWVHLSKDIY